MQGLAARRRPTLAHKLPIRPYRQPMIIAHMSRPNPKIITDKLASWAIDSDDCCGDFGIFLVSSAGFLGIVTSLSLP